MKQGMLRIQITVADPIDLLWKIAKLDIPVMDVIFVDAVTCYLTTKRRYIGKLEKLAAEEYAEVTVIKNLNITSEFVGLIKRPVLLLGIFLWVFLLLYLPGRVLFVQVIGNRRIEASQILEKAEACGVSFGVSRRDLRSEKIKNALLSSIPQLQWVGVNTYGSLAVITVEERTQPMEVKSNSPMVGNIVASRDGVISSVVTTKGTTLCRPGQAVVKGQLLVSGYTDGGIAMRAETASAEVFAITERVQTACFLERSQIRGEIIEVRTEYCIQIGKSVVELSRKNMTFDSNCAKIYETDVLTLPGGFRLPIAMIREINILYAENEESDPFEDNEIEKLSDLYLEKQMLTGRILLSDHQMKTANGMCKISSVYICEEMIGMLRKEEIVK